MRMIASLPYIWQWPVQGSLHCHSQWGWPPQSGRDCWHDSWQWNSTPESGMAIGRGKGAWRGEPLTFVVQHIHVERELFQEVLYQNLCHLYECNQPI